MKVEVLRKEGLSEGTHLVERIDGYGPPFEVNAQELTSFGSHDPESKHQICKRQEFEMAEKLLQEKNCTIEKVEEDGNCLFRAVARQILGCQEKHQEVRLEVVEWIIAHRSLLV